MCEKFYLKTRETEIREEAAVPRWLTATMVELTWESGCPWCHVLCSPSPALLQLQASGRHGAPVCQDKPSSIQRAATFLALNKAQQGTEVSLSCVPLFPERGPYRCSGEEGDNRDTEEGGEGVCGGSVPQPCFQPFCSRFNPSIIFPAFVHPETHLLPFSATQRCPSNLPVPKPFHLRASPPPPPLTPPPHPHQLPCPPSVAVLAKPQTPSSPSLQCSLLVSADF